MKKLIAGILLIPLAAMLYLGFVWLTLPDVSTLKTTNPISTALMRQRAAEKGRKLQMLARWTPYNRIAPSLRNAVLTAEDDAFFQHSGFDYQQIRDAAQHTWKDRKLGRGASTITQQLAKNLYLSTSRNPLRKVREAFIAREMEQSLSKQRIFEIYLNSIEWGDGIYGIGEASHHYFGKSPGELLPEESAILAAMIPNPRRYTPAQNKAYLERRKSDLLARMARYGYLKAGEFEEARIRPVVYAGFLRTVPQ